jgi:hypothetical protein
MNDIKMTKPKYIGKEIMVKDLKHQNKCVAARYIDEGRRVRILTGENEGEVLTHGYFQVLEKIEPAEGTFKEFVGLLWGI